MIYKTLMILVCCLTLRSSASAEDFCTQIQQAWDKVQNYQCQYSAQTLYEGKNSLTKMIYSYQKPSLVRMDIQAPRNGAVLIYNPDISNKVRVRPFATVEFMVLKFELTNPKVTSDNGGTIDRSDLGHRMQDFCLLYNTNPNLEILQKEDKKIIRIPTKENGKNFIKQFTFNSNNLLIAIDLIDQDNNTIEKFRWENLKTNIHLGEKTFIDF